MTENRRGVAWKIQTHPRFEEVLEDWLKDQNHHELIRKMVLLKDSAETKPGALDNQNLFKSRDLLLRET